MKTGDWLEDMLAGAPLSAVLEAAASLAQSDALYAADYDGPATVRDVENDGPDTSPATTLPTLPAIYSRDAA